MPSSFITTSFPQPAYTPPELVTFERTLDWRKVDVWALGVTLYMLLLGELPDWSRVLVDNTMRPMQTNVLHPQFRSVCREGGLAMILNDNGITHIPDEAVEVLQGMLRANPNQRLSTEQILNHRWLA